LQIFIKKSAKFIDSQKHKLSIKMPKTGRGLGLGDWKYSTFRAKFIEIFSHKNAKKVTFSHHKNSPKQA
jgi:hypothetical protein